MEYIDLELKAFTIIDKFLLAISENKEKNFITYGKNQEYFIAKQLMEKYDLINFRAPGETMSIVDITIDGLNVLKAGGMINFLKNIDDQNETAILKQDLEIEKLDIEIGLINKQLKDYLKTKSWAIAAVIISASVLIFEIIKWVIELANK
jgi:hypothetical protein